jgi:ArsR family transcriptional regulator, arsenate/arsenite/antimonite-responsive transcriptional repressor
MEASVVACVAAGSRGIAHHIDRCRFPAAYFLVMSATEQTLDEMLHAVADPTRRRILNALKEKRACSIGKDTGLCACDVEQRMHLSQPTISHHMGILKKAGLVQASKQGQWVWYRRNETALRELARNLRSAL